jgi:putative CocE/NonD family hydrolase
LENLRAGRRTTASPLDASTGSTPHPVSDREIEDYREVVDWIICQPWSDGQVGATGLSYEGIAAELLTIAHPATRVVVPQQADLDQYAEFLFPGGIANVWMITTWQDTNEALDRNRFP